MFEYVRKDSWLSRLGSGQVFAVLMIAMDLRWKARGNRLYLESQYLFKGTAKSSSLPS